MASGDLESAETPSRDAESRERATSVSRRDAAATKRSCSLAQARGISPGKARSLPRRAGVRRGRGMLRSLRRFAVFARTESEKLQLPHSRACLAAAKSTRSSQAIALSRILRDRCWALGWRTRCKELLVRSRDFDLARAIGLRLPRELRPRGRLSAREQDVYDLLVQGRTNHEIAKTLFISESTTKVHVRHIFEKLGVHTRAEAAASLPEQPSLDSVSAAAVSSGRGLPPVVSRELRVQFERCRPRRADTPPTRSRESLQTPQQRSCRIELSTA